MNMLSSSIESSAGIWAELISLQTRNMSLQQHNMDDETPSRIICIFFDLLTFKGLLNVLLISLVYRGNASIY